MKCSNCGAENPEGKKFCGECGSMIVATPAPPVQYVPLQYVPVPPRQPLQLRVNVFCLIGAILGVLSLFLPWAVTLNQDTNVKTYLGAFDFGKTFLGIGLFPNNFQLSVTVFIIGAAVAFISPLGGIMQLVGAMGFVLTTLTWVAEGFQMIFWIGAGVALISTAFVLLSLGAPIGVGFEKGRNIGLIQLLTFSAFR